MSTLKKMNTSLLCFCFKTASSIYVISVCYAGSTRNLHNGTLRLPPATWPSCKVAAFSSLIELMATAHLLQTFSCNNSLLSRSLSLSLANSLAAVGVSGDLNCCRIATELFPDWCWSWKFFRTHNDPNRWCPWWQFRGIDVFFCFGFVSMW